ELSPQHSASPGGTTAHVCVAPADTERTDEMPKAFLGTRTVVLAPPSPTCPYSPSPQHTNPVEVAAQVGLPPAETERTPEDIVWTCVGARTGPEVTPLPVWPKALDPQQRTAPAEVRAHVCAPPADTPTMPDGRPAARTGEGLPFDVAPSPS